MLSPTACQTWHVIDGRRQRLHNARLYLVTPGIDAERLDAALRGGVEVVQLRCKDEDDQTVLELAEVLRRGCLQHKALFIVNDRPDLAVRAQADGVHVGQDDVPVRRARQIVGAERLVGLSTHTREQIAAASGVDYIGVGPVHSTPTKPGRPAVGTELVRHAAAHAKVPWFAIGGISEQTIGAVVAAGAARVAVVRALSEADDPEAAARRLRTALGAGARPDADAA
jgi:thiamine-phosphate pyrophosphorylase